MTQSSVTLHTEAKSLASSIAKPLVTSGYKVDNRNLQITSAQYKPQTTVIQ